MEKEEKVAWNRMKEDTKDHYITKLLHTAEQGAVALSKAYKHSAEMQIKTADVGKERGRMSLPFGKKIHRVEIQVYACQAKCTCSEISLENPILTYYIFSTPV